jgi:hypothetical protein
MPICKSSDDATAAVYAATDDKKLQEPYGDIESSPGCCSRLSEIRCSLSAFSCFGSFCWSVPLAIASPLLAIAWYVVVPFFIDTDTMGSKYAFTPMSEKSYTGWGLSLLIIVPITIMPHVGVVCAGADRGARWGAYFMSFIYVILLIVGNGLSAGQESKRLAVEPEFAVKFNEYYCDSRMLRVCLEGSDDEMLVLMGRNATTGLNGTENSTHVAALSIWSQCRKVITDAMERSYKDEDDSPGEKEIETGPIYRFLNDVGGSSEVDAWCASVLHRATPTAMTDEEQRTLPAPFALKPEMFQKYTREWSRRMVYSNVLLGTSVGCMVLAAWSWEIRDASNDSRW